MDFLLISPPLSLNERYGKRRVGKIGGQLPPLGLAYIAAFLREKKFSVGLLDGAVEDLSEDEIIKKIKLQDPKIIGFSAMTFTFHRAANFAKKIKSQFPNALIVIGGHHATLLPRQVLLENSSFDLVVHGEGELTALDIVQKFKKYNFNKSKFLNDSSLLETIQGIAFRKQKQIKINSPSPHIEDLDKLPYPAWDLLPMNKYLPLPNQYLNKPVVHLVASRGCPFQCSFCSANAVFGKKIRSLSPSKLVDMLEYVRDKFGAREISFWDDSLTVNKKWLFEFCRLLIKKKLGLTWSCYARVNCVDKQILSLMKKAGCWNIFYGFESGNQELLNKVGKNITLEQIRLANKLTKEAGIEVRASFMIALPGETPGMAQKTIDFAISLDPDYAQFCITTPFPGTKLREDARRYGRLWEDFSSYNVWEAVFVPKGYKNRKEIEEMEKKAVRQFYLRPGYLLGRLKKIRSFNDLARNFKGLRMLIGFIN